MDNELNDSKSLKKKGFIKKDDDLMTDDEIDELNKLRNQLLNKIIKEKEPKGKDWFKEQNSIYNYEVDGTVKKKLR